MARIDERSICRTGRYIAISIRWFSSQKKLEDFIPHYQQGGLARYLSEGRYVGLDEVENGKKYWMEYSDDKGNVTTRRVNVLDTDHVTSTGEEALFVDTQKGKRSFIKDRIRQISTGKGPLWSVGDGELGSTSAKQAKKRQRLPSTPEEQARLETFYHAQNAAKLMAEGSKTEEEWSQPHATPSGKRFPGFRGLDIASKAEQMPRGVVPGVPVTADTPMFGSRVNANTAVFCYWQQVFSQCRTDWNTVSYLLARSNAPFDQRLTIDKDRNVTKVNGNTIHTAPVATFSNNVGLFIGNVGTSAQYANNFRGTMYSCKIYDNDVLVRDFLLVPHGNTTYSSIPAPSNCRWDKVTRQYFTNDGTGSFGVVVDTVGSGGYKAFRKQLVTLYCQMSYGHRIEVDYGDNSSIDTLYPETSTSDNATIHWTFMHRYAIAGIYTAGVTVYRCDENGNDVDSRTQEVQIMIEELRAFTGDIVAGVINNSSNEPILYAKQGIVDPVNHKVSETSTHVQCLNGGETVVVTYTYLTPGT